MNFLERFSVKKLHDDLDYWIMIKIGDDIVTLKSQRQEYQPLVEKYRGDVEGVLVALKFELKLPWYKRPTFWHLVRLNFKRLLRIV